VKGATTSIRVFAIYLLVLGPLLIVAPALVLGPFGIPVPGDVWIRVVGVLAAVIGAYYLQASRAGFVPFYRATIPVRAFVFVTFLAFALLGLAPAALVLFGAVDLAGAAWTALALRAASAGT
jgi:hypothetical protein